MIVIVLSSCPTGLRGDLTKWALEVSAGVFVGNVSARVRELLWQRIEETAGTGQALMVWPAQNEQRGPDPCDCNDATRVSTCSPHPWG